MSDISGSRFSGNWRKSTYSGPGGNECLEVTMTGNQVAARDSKDHRIGFLTFGTVDWKRLIDSMRAYETHHRS